MKAILSSTTAGDIKSKVINKEMSILSFDCYITPSEFAEIIEKYEGREFEIEIK